MDRSNQSLTWRKGVKVVASELFRIGRVRSRIGIHRSLRKLGLETLCGAVEAAVIGVSAF